MTVGLIPDPELGMVSRLPEGLGHLQQQGMVPWLHDGSKKKGGTLMVCKGNLTPNPALELGKVSRYPEGLVPITPGIARFQNDPSC